MEQEGIDSVRKFLESAVPILGWGELENEIVMDIGCGFGYGSTMFLMDIFPKLNRIIGIDQASDLIELAINDNIYEKISYYVADIADSKTLKPWKRKLSKLVCVDCLVWLRDQKIAFVNMFQLLRPGGTAAIMTGINSPFPEALNYLLKNTEWQHSPLGTESQFPRFPNKRLESQDYLTMLNEIGFEVVHWEEFFRTYNISKNLYERYGKDFISPLMILIPNDQHEKFKSDFHTAFNTVHGITSEENYRVRLKTVSLFIRKP